MSESLVLDRPRNARAVPGEWFILTAVVLWSTGGVAIKCLPLSPMAISAGRSLITALFFIALVRGTERPRVDRRYLATGAVIYAFAVTSYVVANKLTTAANAIILQYTAPFWIAALAWPLLGERPRPRDLGVLSMAGLGVLVCMSEGLQVSFAKGLTLSTIGDLVALASGLTFGALIILLRKTTHLYAGDAARRVNMEMLIYGNVLAAAIGLPFLLGDLRQCALGVLGVGLLLWLGIAQLGGGYLAFQRGIRTSTALRASTLLLLEPVLNPIWVALAVGERPSVRVVVGGGAVLVALVLNAALGQKAKGETA